LLLYGTTELKDFSRGESFYWKLRAVAVPSCNDLANMAKCFAHENDADGLRAMLADARSSGWPSDDMARNRVMAAFAQAGRLNLVEEIAADDWFGPLDIVAYNMLMKCYRDAGNLLRCFELYEEAKAGGLSPTDRTFGILLDGCAAVGDYERARDFFHELQNSKLPVNIVHYTTFLKCLVNANQLDAAREAMTRMRNDTGVAPDLITYSTLVKGYSDRGHVTNALRLLEQAVEDGIYLDSVVFNVVLSGCCVSAMQPELIASVLSRLLRLGFRPSSSTLSILVKAYACTGAWKVALRTLEEAPARLGTRVEPRVFAQLAQACCTAGEGEMALEVYSATVRAFDLQGEPLGEAAHARLRRLCASCGPEIAAAVLEIYRSSPWAALDALSLG
jgi:pentatricopeptide repeat protein